MRNTKAKNRIESKNLKREAQKLRKEPESVPVPAPEEAALVGPEPKSLKESVKKGILTEKEALELLTDDPTTIASPQMVKWLRRRL